MIRQQAFIEKRKMLKGALHCHTTRSDGKFSPEEALKIFKEHDYDFVSLTDHRIYNLKNFAPELGLTVIPGIEVDNGLPSDHGFRCYHILCLGPTAEDGNGCIQDESYPHTTYPDQESYQPYLDEMHRKNNITIYAHPEWSSTPPRYFEKLKGNCAMEIWNTGSANSNYCDNHAAYWDDILGKGIKMYGVATDDCHNLRDYCGGWVMVNSENNINDILSAIESGKFYSSCGPEIKDFYVDGETAYVDCSEAQDILLQRDCFPTKRIHSESGDLTHGEFDLKLWGSMMNCKYCRITVIDKNGKQAWTNPIWLEDDEK